MMRLPVTMPNLPSYRKAVDDAASAENLKALASTTRDAQVLLGLSFLAKAGDPVRKELAEMAVGLAGNYAAPVAVLSLVMERIDEGSVGELVRRDPDNALGHYLQGTLLHISDRDNEALVVFRKAAACSELRLYDSTTGEALFKALDVLGLQGLDRLCALSWTAARWANFSSAGIQAIHLALSELARPADIVTRTELAEILLSLAGHLFATNFHNRWFARQAAQAALGLQAELAAGTVPKMNGYAAVIQGLTNAMLPCAGPDQTPTGLQLAQDLPAKIHRAFAAADPAMLNSGVLGETNINPLENDRPAFETAKSNLARAGQKLIDVALTDPDGILGAYLKGLPQSTDPGQHAPWASFGTPVGQLMQERADLFAAAAANEEALQAVIKCWQNDPATKNMQRLLDIAWGLQTYAQRHEMTYPDGLAALFESGVLKPSIEVRSLLTGRPFVYVAAREKCPAKANDRAAYVLVYDDEPNQYGCYSCAFASCVGSHIVPRDLEEQLRRRGSSASRAP